MRKKVFEKQIMQERDMILLRRLLYEKTNYLNLINWLSQYKTEDRSGWQKEKFDELVSTYNEIACAYNATIDEFNTYYVPEEYKSIDYQSFYDYMTGVVTIYDCNAETN